MKICIFLTTVLFVVVSGKKYNLIVRHSEEPAYESSHYFGPYGVNPSNVINESTVLEYEKLRGDKLFSEEPLENQVNLKNRRLKRQVRKHYLEPLFKIILNKWQRIRKQILSRHITLSTLDRLIQPAMNYIRYSYSGGYLSDYELISQLRALWRITVKDFSLEQLLEHVRYINSMHAPGIFGNTDFFINRMRLELEGSATEFLPEYYLDRLLDIHVVDPSVNASGIDFFSNYRGRIDARNFYWEVHAMECFRVLFASLEILERYIINSFNGFRSSHDDAVDDCVTAEIIEMLENNTVYSNYLLNKKHKELSFVENNNDTKIFRQRLEGNIRVREPELLMLFYNRIKYILFAIDVNLSTEFINSLHQIQNTDISVSKDDGLDSAKSNSSKKSDKCYDIDFENPVPSCSGTSSSFQQHREIYSSDDIEDEGSLSSSSSEDSVDEEDVELFAIGIPAEMAANHQILINNNVELLDEILKALMGCLKFTISH